MGRRAAGSSFSPSSSSSDFEFTVSLSPSSRRSASHLCPADELFYKGQLLPLHLSPRVSMVRTLLSSSSVSSSSTDTASRDSNGSSSSVPADLLLLLPDPSRPSSVTEDDPPKAGRRGGGKYLASLANRFAIAFLNRGGSKKDNLDCPPQAPPLSPPPAGRRANSSAKQVIKKYVKKVRPLYERLSPSQKGQGQQQHQPKKKTFSFSIRRQRDMALSTCNIVESTKKLDEDGAGERGVYGSHTHSHSFSGNLRFPRRKRCAGSCPSSMGSSPTHSGLLRIGGGWPGGFPGDATGSASSMEDLQSAIQGAIAHCKITMMQSSSKCM